MRLTLLLLVTMLTMNICAESEKRMIAYSFYFVSSEKQSELSDSEAIFEFRLVSILDQDKSATVRYSIDGVEHKVKLKDRTFVVKSKPGKHKFQIYINDNYFEIYSDSLEIPKAHLSVYNVYLERNRGGDEIMVEKPIIYLYPKTDTIVTVQLDVKGDLTFTYPEYNDGWTFKASPDGELTFGEDTYNYLFWESSERYVMHSNGYASGFHVKGEDVTSFLEEKLTAAGLTSKEQSDFITYWAPRMARNKLNFVRFEFNETCNRFAELDISPKPDNLYRIYMLWFPTTSDNAPNPQHIETVNRNGFTVLEWGGQELPRQMNKNQID